MVAVHFAFFIGKADSRLELAVHKQVERGVLAEGGSISEVQTQFRIGGSSFDMSPGYGP